MEKQEAEASICKLVTRIDAIRLTDMPEADKVKQIAEIEGNIKELVEVTGPRHLIGKKVR